MKGTRLILAGAAVGAFALAGMLKANAQLPGNLITLTSGGLNARALFTVKANTPTNETTVEVNGGKNTAATGPIWNLTIGSTTSQLLGIGAIFLVSVNGTTPSPGAPVDTATGAGFVSSTVGATSGTNWTPATDGGYGFFSDTNPPPVASFSDGTHVIETGSLAGRSKTFQGDIFGSFRFKDKDFLDSNKKLYYIGIDYLIAKGTTGTDTGRGYFAVDDGGGGTQGDVPEPMFYQLGSLVGLGGLGLFRLRRKQNA